MLFKKQLNKQFLKIRRMMDEKLKVESHSISFHLILLITLFISVVTVSIYYDASKSTLKLPFLSSTQISNYSTQVTTLTTKQKPHKVIDLKIDSVTAITQQNVGGHEHQESQPYSTKMAMDEVALKATKNNVEQYRNLKVKTIFILATWRSGSSFFGESLAAHPGIFYHFEPLMYLNYREISGGPLLDEVLHILSQLSQCQYKNVSKYTDKLDVGWNTLTLNNKISDQCKKLERSCLDQNFTSYACQLYPLQLIKVVRLRGVAAEELLKKIPNIRIIYLVRDPRAIYASRMKVPWCRPKTPCGHIPLLCEALKVDLQEIKNLQSKHPDVIQLIKYEDVALNTVQNFKHIFKNLGIPWHSDVEKYIYSHTHNNTDDPMSTFKKSTTRVDRWKSTLQGHQVSQIQTECSDFMQQLHYSFVQGIGENRTFVETFKNETKH